MITIKNKVPQFSVNDNAPQFVRRNYSHTLSEDVKPGTSFLRVEATDADLGENGRITYSIEEVRDK